MSHVVVLAAILLSIGQLAAVDPAASATIPRPNGNDSDPRISFAEVDTEGRRFLVSRSDLPAAAGGSPCTA